MSGEECFEKYAGEWTAGQIVESIQPDGQGQTIHEVKMRMAKASDADLEMGRNLFRMLDALNDGMMPVEIDPKGDGYFDIDDGDECRDALRLLLDTFESDPGGLFRIVYGMGVLLDPKNKVVNPDSDELERYDHTREERPRGGEDFMGGAAGVVSGGVRTGEGKPIAPYQSDLDRLRAGGLRPA
jgi:hypothetical protein